MQIFANQAIIASVLRIFSIALTFLMFFILAQALDVRSYGIFSTFYSIGIIFGFIASGGQHFAALRFMATHLEFSQRQNAGKSFCWSLILVFFLSSALGLIIIIGLECVKEDLADDEWFAYRWLPLFIFSWALTEFLSAALRVKGRIFIALLPREVIWRCGVMALTLFVATPSAQQATFWMGLVLVTVALWMLWLMRDFVCQLWYHAFQSEKTSSLADQKTALWGMWGTASIAPISAHAATVVVSLVLGPELAGAFFVADKLARLLAVALIGVNQIIGPMLARSFARNEWIELRKLIFISGLAGGVFAGLGAVFYIFFGASILKLFSPDYIVYTPILIILSIGQVYNALCGSNTMFLTMTGKEGVAFSILLTSSAVQIVLLFFMTAYFNLLGAAIATISGVILWNTLISLITYREIRRHLN